MRISVLGTGIVGQTIGTKLIELGHQVCMGSRTADNADANKWVQANGTNASQGTFADAAACGEMVFNCTSGMHSLEALASAGAQNLSGKIIVDISNPLDFSKGMPPTLSVCNTDSLAEQIQRAFPNAKVVKTLNTVSARLMANPSLIKTDHDIFVSGNDMGAKTAVTEMLKSGFGWKSVMDLGDITTARGTEMLLALWVRLFGKFDTPNFNIKIVRE